MVWRESGWVSIEPVGARFVSRITVSVVTTVQECDADLVGAAYACT